jgi:large subunit ribosomal protein L22
LLIRAEQKNIRISAQKMRLVADAVRKLDPIQAVLQLKFLKKRAALALAKVIKQAIANGTNNLQLGESGLKFHRLEIGEGPTYKRWQPVSRGRAHPILKRTSHIKVVLESPTVKARNPKLENLNKSKLSKSK